jgi:hypothetical protein
MKYGRSFYFSILIGTLTGCAGNPPPTQKIVSTSDIKSENSGRITLDTIYFLKTEMMKPTDTNLRLISRSDTATAVAVKTLRVLLGNRESTFDKNQLVGTSITSEVNPSANYLTPKVADKIAQAMKKKAPQVYKNHIIISVYNWYLVYENLSGGENYELNYLISIDKKSENNQKYIFFSCEPDPVKIPLTEWQKNNHQKVNEVTITYMNTCLTKFDKKIDEFMK